MFHLDDLGPPVPRLPLRRSTVIVQLSLSAGLHLAVASMIVAFVGRSATPALSIQPRPAIVAPIEVRHMVFIARDRFPIGGGGGGGGNHQAGPIRHAHAIGSDNVTLRVTKPMSTSSHVTDLPMPPQLILDAKPLASGSIEQVGLPTGGVSFGTSTGPGSGGGAGEGIGTGVGPGRGPGIGPGSGGGIGGGVYRPGGAVTPPRVIAAVKPTYTSEALLHKIQGTVALELVVKRDGRPSEIRVIQSLDPEGLDEQALIAASQWRFEPGRFAGSPVDVLVTIMIDFWIR